MRHLTHKVDFCVVGGGLSGMCAAIAAARHGAKVALMQDRPVLGGNASSEIRMWICGAHGDNNRETGIVEEIALENRYRNPLHNYSLWDSVLYEKARFEPNITLLLNCSCNELEMDGDRIRSVTGWQLTTRDLAHRRGRPLCRLLGRQHPRPALRAPSSAWAARRAPSSTRTSSRSRPTPRPWA